MSLYDINHLSVLNILYSFPFGAAYTIGLNAVSTVCVRISFGGFLRSMYMLMPWRESKYLGLANSVAEKPPYCPMR